MPRFARTDMPADSRFTEDLNAFFQDLPNTPPDPLDGSQGSFTILNVCTGNICRSALAEGMFKNLLGALSRDLHLGDIFFRVRSSGTRALVGNPADPPVAQLAATIGIDLNAHRASLFTPDHAENAQLILTATTKHRDEVVKQAPSSVNRVFTLREFTSLLKQSRVKVRTAPSVDPREILMSVVAQAHMDRQLRPFTEGDSIQDPYRQTQEIHSQVFSEIVQISNSITQKFREILT